MQKWPAMGREELLLRGLGRTLPLSVRRWAEAVNPARTKGWIPPEPKTSLLLIGHIVDEEDAEKLADALNRVDVSDASEYLTEVVEFCKAGAFMVEPLGVKNG